MDEKIQQLTNEQLLDVIVLVEENKIIQAIQYIATHTAFQYDDAQLESVPQACSGLW